MNKSTPCPICQKPTSFDARPSGPFCSERCQLLDLGKWLREDYRISEPLCPDHFAEFEQMEGDGLDRTEH